MKAVIIIVLVGLGIWGVCQIAEKVLPSKTKAALHTAVQKANAAEESFFAGVNRAIDEAFDPAIEYSEKQWPKDFRAGADYLDHHMHPPQPSTPRAR